MVTSFTEMKTQEEYWAQGSIISFFFGYAECEVTLPHPRQELWSRHEEKCGWPNTQKCLLAKDKVLACAQVELVRAAQWGWKRAEEDRKGR